MAGAPQISRNGKFVLTRFTSHLNLSTYTRYELGSPKGARYFTSVWGNPTNQPIANTGEFLLFERPDRIGDTPPPFRADLFVISGDAAMTRAKIAENVEIAALSPDGRRIAFVRRLGEQREFVLLNRDTNSERIVASSGAGYVPMFANDGSLFWRELGAGEAPAQMFFEPVNGSAQALNGIGEQVTAAVISGDGRLVYAAALSGRIVRISTETGETREIVPSSEGVPDAELGAAVAPGSAIRLFGRPSEKVEVMVGSTRLPVVSRGLSTQAIQVPWDLRNISGPQIITVREPGAPFFTYTRTLFVQSPRLTVDLVPDARSFLVPAIAHQDFRGLVSTQDPAAPGETIHVFARNLGPVDRPVATGEISPSDPPARITTPLACYLRELDQTTQRHRERIEGLTIPFAGLTAGSVGGYHIDITIPAEWPAGTHELLCQLNGAGTPITVAIGR